MITDVNAVCVDDPMKSSARDTAIAFYVCFDQGLGRERTIPLDSAIFSIFVVLMLAIEITFAFDSSHEFEF